MEPNQHSFRLRNMIVLSCAAMKPFHIMAMAMLLFGEAYAQTAPPAPPPSLGEIARQQREAREAREAGNSAVGTSKKVLTDENFFGGAKSAKSGTPAALNCTTFKNQSGTGTVCTSGLAELPVRNLAGLTACADLKCLASAAESRTPAYLDRAATGTMTTVRTTSKYHWELMKYTGDRLEMYLSQHMTDYKFDPEGARRMQMTEEQIAKAIESEKDTITAPAGPQEGTCVYPLADIKGLLGSVGATPSPPPKMSAEERRFDGSPLYYGSTGLVMVLTLGGGECKGPLFGKP